MRTIIQHIGPLLGEVNTGSVFGQPNGSIANGQGFSPAPTPTPSLAKVWNIDYYTGDYNRVYNSIIWYYGGTTRYFYFTYNGNTSTGTGQGNNGPIVKIELLEDIQDTSAHMTFELATDAKFTNIIRRKAAAAGSFTTDRVYYNQVSDGFTAAEAEALGLTKGQILYLRVLLEDSSGNSLNRSSNTLQYTWGGN